MEERREKTMSARNYRNESRRKVEDLCLMDDRFMNVCLKDDVENVQLIVRIILGKPDLIVTDVQTQEVVKSLIGRDVEFDITATDSSGKLYNIEIQRTNAGAGRKQARYHSSVIDAKTLEHGQDFDALPETYVIFITEHDPLGGGKPIYHIDRRIEEMGGELFGDEAHIIYVNGSCKDLSTELGRLMSDLSCKDPKKMNFKSLADKVWYFKYNQKGLEIMTGTLAAWAEEITGEAMEIGEKKGEKKSKVEIAQKLIQRGGMEVEEIAELTGLTVKNVQKLVEKKAE